MPNLGKTDYGFTSVLEQQSEVSWGLQWGDNIISSNWQIVLLR